MLQLGCLFRTLSRIKKEYRNLVDEYKIRGLESVITVEDSQDLADKLLKL